MTSSTCHARAHAASWYVLTMLGPIRVEQYGELVTGPCTVTMKETGTVRGQL